MPWVLREARREVGLQGQRFHEAVGVDTVIRRS